MKDKICSCRITASTYGILVGLAGIMHGVFEILQGYTSPDSLLSPAIGPSQRFWEYGTLHALTVFPNYFISGVLAVIFGVLVFVWAFLFIEKKYGAGVLMLLSGILFIVGGGFAPIFTAILASLIATRINKPLLVWKKVVPHIVQMSLSKLWPWTLIAFVLIFIITVAIAVFGWPLTLFINSTSVIVYYLNILSYIMLFLMIISVFVALREFLNFLRIL